MRTVSLVLIVIGGVVAAGLTLLQPKTDARGTMNRPQQKVVIPVTILARKAVGGQPVAYLPIVARPMNQGSAQGIPQTVQTDGNGQAVFQLVAGQYLLQPVQLDRYLGTLPVDVQAPITAPLILSERGENRNAP